MLKNEGWQLEFPLGMAYAGLFGLSFERFWEIRLSKRLFFGVWTHFSPRLMRKELAYRPDSAF
jgi:hypothetical protein